MQCPAMALRRVRALHPRRALSEEASRAKSLAMSQPETLANRPAYRRAAPNLARPTCQFGHSDPPLTARDLPFAWAPRRQKGQKGRSEEHTSELQSLTNLVCRLL